MWKVLTCEEELEFRRWARDNYKTLTDICGVWHPAVQDECVKINIEKGREMNEQLGGE